MKDPRFQTEFFRNDVSRSAVTVGETTKREAKLIKSAGIVLACLIFAAGMVVGAWLL